MKALFIGALLLTATAMVLADEASSFCEYGTYQQMLSGECLCTRNFPRKEIPTEVSFAKVHKLVGVCGFGYNRKNDPNHEVNGTFQFRSTVTVDGVVEYSVGSEGVFYFHAKKGSIGGWLEGEIDDSALASKLKASHVNLVDSSSAKGKLKIKEFYIQYDSGAIDRMGLTKFDVIEIGKFYSPEENK